jgi:carbon monoxide dehydrogenase subunit G
MIKQEFTQQINVPVERVFAYVTDFRNNAKWQEGVVESTQTPDGPTQLGTKFKTVRTLLGQKLEATGEVTEFEPNKKMAFKSTSGPIKFSMSQTFEADAGGTKLIFQAEVEAGGFFKLAEGALSGNMKKMFEDQIKKLEEVLER